MILGVILATRPPAHSPRAFLCEVSVQASKCTEQRRNYAW